MDVYLIIQNLANFSLRITRKLNYYVTFVILLFKFTEKPIKDEVSWKESLPLY